MPPRKCLEPIHPIPNGSREKKCRSRPIQGGQLRCCLECQCVTKKKTKCSRRVCFGDVCWQHARALYGIRTKFVKEPYYDSNKKRVNLNRGLYSERDFPKGCILGLFDGEILTPEELERRYPGTTLANYGIRAFLEDNKTPVYYDNRETCSNLPRFANDSRGLYKKKRDRRGRTKYIKVKDNAEMVDNVGGKAPMLLTTKNIKAGDQIFLSYGDEYWKQQP